MKRWESVGAAVYYGLGISYYFYHWFFVAGIGAALLSVIFRNRPLFFGLLLAIAFALFFFGSVVWITKTKKRLHFINPDLLITKLVDTYDVSAAPRYVNDNSLTVRARRAGIDSYHCKFRWSGNGSITPHVEPADQLTTTLTRSSDDWNVVRVQFSRPLKKKEIKAFTLRLELTDEAGSALPFFQKYIDDFYPGGLTMRVVLAAPPKSTLKEIFLSPRVELPLWSHETKMVGTSEIKWKIPKPALGRRYRLCWVP